MASKSNGKLSVIIPVYNEEKTIERVIRAAIDQKHVGEVIVVDDGSTDNSRPKIQKLKSQLKAKNLILKFNSRNLGKGAALRDGIKQARYPYTIVQDADLEYDPRQFGKLVEFAGENVAVYGSRLKGKNKKAYFLTYIGNVLLTYTTNALFGTRLSDSYTCYKLMPTRLARSLGLTSNGFEIEAEITGKLAKRGIEILEVPISYFPRSYKQGKKIKTKDALKGLLMLLKIKFSNN